jgi:type IV secretion system protein TrbL
MHRPRRLCPAPAAAILLALALFFCCAPARAEVQSANLVDQVLQEYQQAAKGWESVLLDEAKTTFWELATISLVVTVCWMLLRGADLMALTAELVGFVVMTLFFWWLLTNGPSFGQAIVNGLRLLGSRGSGTDQALYPSQVLDIGFRIYSKAVSELSLYLLG